MGDRFVARTCVAVGVSTDPVDLPGGRDVRASLDHHDESAPAVVVACPPHPQHGGSRHDGRLRAVSDALGPTIDCLRFDYGPWDEGRGERADARTACAWAAERYDAVGLFGYSFGGGVALCAAPGAPVDAVSALAPVRRLADGSDVAAAVAGIAVPLQVVFGTRDDTVASAPVVAAAREAGAHVEAFAADHFYVGQEARVGEVVAEFFAATL